MDFKKAQVITEEKIKEKVKVYGQCDACGDEENLNPKMSG
jgi:hypothetical protein